MDSSHTETVSISRSELAYLQSQASKYQALITPEINDYLSAVKKEALFQRERWASNNDDGKADSDWFWLIGYLSGKALASLLAGNLDKGLHHIISTSAALLNWHAAKKGMYVDMRPGTKQDIQAIEQCH